MQITAIEPQKRKKDRVNIFLDGEFAFSLDHETLLKNSLSSGQKLTQEQIENLAKEGEFAYWYNKALRFLSFRPRSQKEILDYFRKNKVGGLIVKSIVKKLREKKFIDDVAFAKWFIKQRIDFRPKGKIAIVTELHQKGISENITSIAIQKVGFNELRLAKKALRKKEKTFGRYPAKKQKEKAVAFLKQRGFSWDTIEKVLLFD